MKRGNSGNRAPSPTLTAFSGISNYRTDSYRPINKSNAPAVPSLDPRAVARTHFDELSRYLSAYLARAPPNARATARQKLTRLTRQQFQELSTDVYDELVRRKKNSTDNEVPFLPVRSDFHPKRNQARQKLATLPTSRFEDLSSDVYFELVRRYPEFKEEASDSNGPMSPGSAYDDSPDLASFPQPAPVASFGTRSGQTSDDNGADSGYAGSSYGRKASEDRRRPSEDDYGGRRSEELYGGGGRSSEDNSGSRRRPSQDAVRISEERERERGDFVRRPSASASVTSDSTSTTNAQSATATSGMIIPNKSTIAEEEIEVPYGRDLRESSSTAIDERERDRSRDIDTSGVTDGERVSSSPLGGLNGLSARLRGADDDDDDEDVALSGAGDRSGEDYFDKLSYGRTSVASDRSAGAAGIGSRASAGRTSTTGEDSEKLRREYEFKIATMQSKITTLERDLGDVEEREKKWLDDEMRVRQLEEELASFRRRAEEESKTVRTLRQELDELEETRAREREREARRAQEDEEELQILRARCEKLEEEREHVGNTQPEIVDQLRSDMEGLLTELSELSRRNDELMTAKDSDLNVIRELDAQMKEYKRKYEQAKTELRSIKATSQLFTQTPKAVSDDQLPMSSDGGVLDIHVTAFMSAIDGLLTSGRSNAPTRVLTPMKAVVNAVSAIIEDVRLYERRPPQDRSDTSIETLRALRDRAEATLGNLVAATKTHAQGSGLSPVSLLDAAASHVAAAVIEIGKTLCIRRATKAEHEQFLPASSSNTSAINGAASSYRLAEESRPPHSRAGSQTGPSARRTDSGFSSPYGSTSRALDSPTRAAIRPSGEDRRGTTSEPSSGSPTGSSSPAPIVDQASQSRSDPIAGDESGLGEGSEDAWTELKPYLEAQTESIVYAIQSVLSGVRSPTPPPTLNENITQIITIVSSIVAVCNDNLPPASAQQGNDILRELSEHATKLSEVQALPEVTKDSRQIMAKSSFAVANAMKGLMKL